MRMYCHIFAVSAKCSPKSSKWEGYNKTCCTTSHPCGEKQGGCLSDDQCSGYLTCSASVSSCVGFATGSGEKCCHVPGQNIIIPHPKILFYHNFWASFYPKLKFQILFQNVVKKLKQHQVPLRISLLTSMDLALAHTKRMVSMQEAV